MVYVHTSLSDVVPVVVSPPNVKITPLGVTTDVCESRAVKEFDAVRAVATSILKIESISYH